MKTSPRSTPPRTLAIVLPLALAACAGEVVTGGGDSPGASGGAGGAAWSEGGSRPTGGTGGWTTSSPSSTGVGAGPTSSSSSSSSGATSSSGGFSGCADPTPVGLPATACTPQYPACNASSSVCLATHGAAGAPTFALRVSHVTFTAPQALMTGVVKSTFDGAVESNEPACYLDGSGDFNWLLRFDTAAGTVTTGAARPVADPTAGYSFLDETLDLSTHPFAIAPVTLAAPLDASCGVVSTAGDVRLPFFFDAAGQSFTLFPLRSLRFLDTFVTPDHDCIGAFNAKGLDPVNGCAPDQSHPSFLDGGRFESFISLEEADLVMVSPLTLSLCVLLSGNATLYGGAPGNDGFQHCKRDAGNAIVFQGDWCGATNQPAAAGCADGMRFAGTFAASGTKVQ